MNRVEPNAWASVAAQYAQHRGHLLKLATLLVEDEEAARDLVQDAFERSSGRLGSVEPDAALAYLRRAVVNLAIDRSRRIAIERRLAPLLLLQQTVEIETALLEEHEVVWRAVCRLPARKRACIVLRYFEDLKQEEVADLLKCSVGTVRSQTSKALAVLRKELGDGHRNKNS